MLIRPLGDGKLTEPAHINWAYLRWLADRA